MGAISSRYGWVKAAEESSYDGGAASASDDALLLQGEPSINEVIENVMADDIVKPTQGGFDHVRIGSHVDFSFSCRVGGMDISNDAAPAIAPILLAAGFAETTSGSSGTTDLLYQYDPLTSGHSSSEFIFAIRDRDTGDIGLHTVTGCRVNFTLNFSVNNDLIIEVNGRGTYSERQPFTSVTNPTTIGLDVGRFKVSAITLTTDNPSTDTTRHCTELTYTPGWEVGQDNSLSSDHSAQEIILNRTGRHNGSFNPRQKAADYDSDDFMDDLRAGTRFAIDVVVSAAQEDFTLTLPAAQCESREDSADGQTWRHQIGYQLSESTTNADDDAQIKWEQTS
jgi:hypothetical protein